MNPAPTSNEPGDELFAAAREGSPEALGWLLDCCRSYLLRIANGELDSRLQAKAGASDIVQEVFVEAQRAFERFHGSSAAELRAWLRAILLNKLADFRRHYRETDKRQIGKEVDIDGPDPPPEPADSIGTPSVLVAREEQAAALTLALTRLPEHYRQVIIWRQIENLSFEQIAERLQRTEDAVRKLWWRAVQHLQQEMGDSL